MYTYIKKSIPKHFVTFEEPLNPEEYNNIGESWEDYLNNKWVLLSDEQVDFKEINANASVKEVWDLMLLQPTVEELTEELTLNSVKEQKILDITNYDRSNAINSFLVVFQGIEAVPAIEGEHYTQEEINSAEEGDDAYGKTTNDWKIEPQEAVEGREEQRVVTWLTPEERANYRNSIDAAKVLGLESVSLYIGDFPVTMSTIMAEQLLAQIQLYADQCYIVTKRHKSTIEALSSIEAVETYDFTIGYPTKLTFTI